MAGAFDETIKEEIRLRADISAIIGRYVKLRQSGQTLKGLCPFHKEKTPSFHVNPSRGFFHCFGCGKGGDVFKFLEEIEGLSFPEALKMLADETGVTLPAHTSSQSMQSEQVDQQDGPALSKSEMVEIHKFAADYFYSMIRKHPQAVTYFKSRGLAPETVRDFKLGFAPPGWSSLRTAAEKKGISTEALVRCGLAVKNEETGSAYDRFRDRVIFSLFDLSGRVVGFAGRGLGKDAVPKYLNSPETLLYRKKEFLYGLNMTRQYIKDEKFALIVEGYMDFLTLFQSGIRNAVATSGTAMTAEHVHLLKRFTSKIILVFDGDAAGQTAAERGIFTLSPFNLDVSILVLPPDEDPDSFVKKFGPEPFREMIAQARSANEFIIDRAIAEHGGKTPRGQKAIVTQLSPLVQAMSDPLAKARFKKDLSERLGLDEKMIYQLLRTVNVEAGGDASTAGGDEAFLRSLEGSFLHLLMSNPGLIAEARRFVAPETLTEDVSGNLYCLMLELFEKRGNLEGIIDAAENQEVQRLLSRMLVKPALEHNVHEELVQKIIHLRQKYLRSRIRDYRLRLKADKDAARSRELMHAIHEALKQLRDLDERE